MNWVFAMNGAGRDPSQSGDWASWFFWYKWEVGGEVWLPVAKVETAEGRVKAGDFLWLFIQTTAEEKQLLGLATVLRVEENHTTEKWEIWYDDDQVRRVPPARRGQHGTAPECLNDYTQAVPEETHKAWMELLDAPPS